MDRAAPAIRADINQYYILSWWRSFHVFHASPLLLQDANLALEVGGLPRKPIYTLCVLTEHLVGLAQLRAQICLQRAHLRAQIFLLGYEHLVGLAVRWYNLRGQICLQRAHLRAQIFLLGGQICLQRADLSVHRQYENGVDAQQNCNYYTWREYWRNTLDMWEVMN